MSKNGVGEFTPAPFTKMSTRAELLQTLRPASFCSAAFEVASHAKNSACAAALGSRRVRVCAFAASRPTSATVAPAMRQTFSHLPAQNARAADDDRNLSLE